MFFAKALDLIRHPSLRFRLTLLYVLIFGVTTIVFNGLLFNSTMEKLQQEFDGALYNYAVDISDTIEIGPKGNLTFPPLRVDEGKILPFPLGTALIQVRHASGEILSRIGEFGTFDPPFKHDFQKLSNGEEAAYRTISHVETIPNAEADSYRMISLPLDSSKSPQLILQIAVPMSLLEAQFSQRLFLLQVGIPIVLLIAVLGGLLVSVRALTPLREVIKTTQKIDASELDQRVPVPKANDEIRSLALTVNEMLSRIEKAFRSQERFVADASHQLLTPLAIMKGELEILMKGSPTPTEIDQFLKSTRQEVDSLAKIVQDMLLLARVDAGLGAMKLQECDAGEVLLEALQRCERLGAAKSIRLIVDFLGDEFRGPIRGDPNLLENLFFNVIENAIKYSPAKESVHVQLEWRQDSFEVRIQDRGSGIPNSEIPLIFERFRRGTSAATKTSGFGLGLAIARQIAHLHGGTLTAENVDGGGALFRIQMKKN